MTRNLISRRWSPDFSRVLVLNPVPLLLGLSCGLIGAFLPDAHALTPHETWIVEGTPSEDQIARWSALPGTRSYAFQISDPSEWALAPLGRLRGADKIRLQFPRFPGEDALPALTRLASRGVELATMDAGFPTAHEVEVLNRLPEMKSVFVSTAYPGEHDGPVLSKLRQPFSLTFSVRAYPRFVDKPVFTALPPGAPLLFSTDYWPWYTHMDVFNLIPQPIRLRVRDMLPPQESLQYLLNIKRLQSVIIDSDYEVEDGALLKALGSLPVTLSFRGRMPGEGTLRALEESASVGVRKLIVDSDTPLTAAELRRLERLSLEVEWIRLAPWEP